MNLSRSSNSTYFLIRQLSMLAKKGLTIEDALAKLRTTIPNKYMSNLETISNLFSEQPDPHKLQSHVGPIARLYNLINIAKRNDGDTQKLLASFYDSFLNTPTRILFKTYDIGNLMFYVMSIFVVLFITVSINSIFVLPQFETMFSSFGADLPAITRVIIFIADKLYWLFILAGGIFIFGTWYIISKTRFNTRTLNYFTSRIYNLPGFKRIASHYNRYLIMNYIAMLIDSGVNKETAIHEVQSEIDDYSVVGTNQTFIPHDDIAVALTSSFQLDTFEAELDFQIQNTLDKSARDFSTLKERLTLFSLITTAIVVGTVVIAIYLPIFQFGKVVS